MRIPYVPDLVQGVSQANVFQSLYQVSKRDYCIVYKSQECQEEKQLCHRQGQMTQYESRGSS